MLMMQEFEVGQCIAKYKGMKDTTFLDFSASGGTLILLMNSPNADERNSVHEGASAEFRYQVIDDVIFMSFKFGSMPWMDAPFCPAIDDNALAPEVIPDGQGLAMLLVLADTNNGEIKEIRLMSFSTSFSRDLAKDIMRLKNANITLQQYYAVVDSVNRKYSSRDMARMASKYTRIR